MIDQANPVLACGHCLEYERVNRRTFLTGVIQSPAMLFPNGIAAFPAWMPRIALADPQVGLRGDTLVCIFLRGGADGLNVIIPHGDENYYMLRPTIGVPRPDDSKAKVKVLDLDGFFGLHPALGALKPIYDAGKLAPVQATGSPDQTRSHFEAMALMERGATTSAYSGWLARHLSTLDTGNNSALRAVAISDMLPASLTGAVTATALQSIGDYHLRARDENGEALRAAIEAMYQEQDDLLTSAAWQTLASIDVLSRIDMKGYQPGGRTYPESDFGRALQTTAQLIHVDVGVEVACVDIGGWDTHAAQGSAEGQMARVMADLGDGLAAFYEDLGAEIENVTVVVMSEFGRRAHENAALGTDHGHGNMMLVIGDGIAGGKVYSRWPGLHPDQLVGPGDLAITTDYRDVLGEVLAKRLNNPQMDQVFPGYAANPLGLAVPRM